MMILFLHSILICLQLHDGLVEKNFITPFPSYVAGGVTQVAKDFLAIGTNTGNLLIYNTSTNKVTLDNADLKEQANFTLAADDNYIYTITVRGNIYYYKYVLSRVDSGLRIIKSGFVDLGGNLASSLYSIGGSVYIRTKSYALFILSNGRIGDSPILQIDKSDSIISGNKDIGHDVLIKPIQYKGLPYVAVANSTKIRLYNIDKRRFTEEYTIHNSKTSPIDVVETELGMAAILSEGRLVLYNNCIMLSDIIIKPGASKGMYEPKLKLFVILHGSSIYKYTKGKVELLCDMSPDAMTTSGDSGDACFSNGILYIILSAYNNKDKYVGSSIVKLHSLSK